MHLEWDDDKEKRNIARHGLDFSLAHHVIADPLGVIVHDRFENGEDRYHALGVVYHVCLVLVFSHPDPDDDDLVRVIGLRKAAPAERKRYEKEAYS